MSGMLIGCKLLLPSMAFCKEAGVPEKFPGLMVSVYGRMFERNGGVSLGFYLLKLEMVHWLIFGPLGGVGLALLRRRIQSCFVLRGIRTLWWQIIFSIGMKLFIGT